MIYFLSSYNKRGGNLIISHENKVAEVIIDSRTEGKSSTSWNMTPGDRYKLSFLSLHSNYSPLFEITHETINL